MKLLAFLLWSSLTVALVVAFPRIYTADPDATTTDSFYSLLYNLFTGIPYHNTAAGEKAIHYRSDMKDLAWPRGARHVPEKQIPPEIVVEDVQQTPVPRPKHNESILAKYKNGYVLM